METNRNIFCDLVNCALYNEKYNIKHKILYSDFEDMELKKSFPGGYTCGEGYSCTYISATGRIREEWWPANPFKIITALIKFNREANE